MEPILTQTPVVIDLSRPAMERIVDGLAHTLDWAGPMSVQIEVANFVNLLSNLIERGVDKAPASADNSDLI